MSRDRRPAGSPDSRPEGASPQDGVPAPGEASMSSVTGGLDTRLDRFPDVDDLPLLDRATVTLTAASDVLLRTSGAAMIGTSMAPHVLRRGQRRREFAAMARYSGLAARGDRDEIFPRVDDRPVVETVRRGWPLTPWLPGAIELLRTPSTYVATDPGSRVAYSRRRNGVAWAQHWRHEDGPRPTVVVVHGFMASPYTFNRYFFSLPWWYANGYDLLLVTLPFHGRRARPWDYSGAGLFGGGPIRLIEGLLHAVHDLRVWIDHLEATGVDQIGMTGVSLGGYLTALMAAVEERLWFAIPNSPVTDFVELLDTWVPSGPVAEALLTIAGIDRRLYADAMRIHSPLHHEPLLPRERLFVITGLGDRLAPPSHAERLWEHWDRPKVHAFPGNHVVHIDRGAYLERVGRFIRGTGFGA